MAEASFKGDDGGVGIRNRSYKSRFRHGLLVQFISLQKVFCVMKSCISCGSDCTLGGTSFGCPSCGATLSRCDACKKRGVHFSCPNNDGFSGP